MNPKPSNEKIKVSQLAKELGLETKDLIRILKGLNIIVKTAASSIEAESAKLVKELIEEQKEKTTKTPPKKEEPKIIEEEIKTEVIKETLEEVITPPQNQISPSETIVLSAKEILVKELAEKLHLKNSDIIKALMSKGILANLNQLIDSNIAKEIAATFNKIIVLDVKERGGEGYEAHKQETGKEERPPIVTIMGHVDHGKTKLLDTIRKSNIVEGEAGGITQHIGAYQVEIHGKKITFLDTPGHEAFTALRARGAKVTDIAILVVAADDGVMPQTLEALDHARAAGVPIIVAINKIDKPEANLDRVKQQLADHGLLCEEWGGQTVTVGISAKQNQNIDQLLEMILLVAEVQELKATSEGPAYGVVIDAKLDRNLGPIATVLIRKGILKIGSSFVVGETFGKVRALINDLGKKIKSAGPSMPVEIFGLNSVPQPGDLLENAPSDKRAKELAQLNKEKREKIMKGKIFSLEDFSAHIREGKRKDLHLIVKADVQGSLEALCQSLQKLSTAEINIHIVHKGIGSINESDIMLAKASSSILIGFHVNFDTQAKLRAEQEGVDTRIYDIIYKCTEDIQLAMGGLLEPEYEEFILGHAEVRSLFKYSKVGVIAGCFIKDGKMVRGKNIRIFRDKKIIYEGRLEALKRFKEDVKEVEVNFECGISISGYKDFKVNDIIEAFEMRAKPRKA